MSESEATALVVEDDEFNRELVVRQLHEEGYRNVDSVGDGRTALDTMRERSVDLVLLDLKLPEVDGFGVLEKMKADMALRSIPILTVSDLDDHENVIRSIELGADAYMATAGLLRPPDESTP